LLRKSANIQLKYDKNLAVSKKLLQPVV